MAEVVEVLESRVAELVSISVQRAIDRASDLLARAGPYRGAQCHAPTIGSRHWASQSQARENRGLVYVGSDLFGSALSGDVLGLRQPSSPGGAGEGDEIVGDHRHSASRALLPWRVSSRIDHHLANGSPTGVMRIAARDQKSRKRVGDPLGVGIGCMTVQMPQRGADVATVVHYPGQFPCGPSWPVLRVVDTSTVLGLRSCAGTAAPRRARVAAAVGGLKRDKLGLWRPSL